MSEISKFSSCVVSIRVQPLWLFRLGEEGNRSSLAMDLLEIWAIASRTEKYLEGVLKQVGTLFER